MVYSKVKDLVLKHYGDAVYVRSDAQLAREEWLIPGVKFNRWVLPVSAFFIQICCGSLYAWSGYNAPIEAAIYGMNGGVDRGMASTTFYIAVAFFGCTAAALGPWMERKGPFIGCMAGTALFFFGNLMTALGVYVNQIALVYIGYGIFGGAGLGLAYISPVSPLQKWFPEYRGLAAGFAVCGFGGGSIIAPYTQKYLIGLDYQLDVVNNVNLGVPLTFVILGAVYFVIMSLGSLVLRMPPPGYEVKGIKIDTVKGAETAHQDIVLHNSDDVTDFSTSTNKVDNPPQTDFNAHFKMTLWESIVSTEFRLMYIMFIGAQITGLMINSKIQGIVSTQFGKTGNEPVNINAILGVLNLLGRMTVPYMSDYFQNRKIFFIISCVVQFVMLGLIPYSIWNQYYGLFLFEVFTIAYFYGAGFGLIPAFLSDQFGSKNIGPTHGIILTAWAMTGVFGGLIFTAVYNSGYNSHYYALEGATKKTWNPADYKYHVYDVDFQWILAVIAVGLISASLIPNSLRDRRLPKAQGEVFRFRLGPRLVRFVGGKFVIVSKADEDKEWGAYLASVAKGQTLAAEQAFLVSSSTA
ncbi:MFS general substrate transporter [Rhizoclosmatium globosum]|uniref:MFS general substrate transporter n=1 Tax=Rhizoclosmatium globosum TaxID=329046 RepID=A0A1Y2CQH8_9FUNG|nr:MFS general substrate transporter [Rhizoclosmatium globosum]|eukprot:ORY49196.1 MFS general substrate transporter [Rhizoclosmatium globosum]